MKAKRTNLPDSVPPWALALLRAFGVILAGCIVSGPAASAEAGQALPAPTQILVDMVDDTGDADEAALEAKLGGLDLRLNSPQAVEERFFIADVPTAHIPEMLARLEGDPRVEHAEPNYYYGLPEGEDQPIAVLQTPSGELLREDPEARRGPRQPNDPLWSRQWSFRMIGAPEAWADADGSGVTVAVIDTGVAFERYKKFRKVEDLDEERFVEGYNFLTDTPHANDDHGHGTHVAGTIAQATFNARGVAGVAYNAKIMPLKVLSRRGFGTAGDIADAIRFAADEGAQVMNLSLGGGPRSRVLESAVAYARGKGVLVVCAAGNGGRARVEYPAAYRGAFAVSSVGPTKNLAFYSSYGPEVAVAGPGGDKNIGGDEGGILQNTIVADRPDQTGIYLSYQGTSMAAPHVAGVAALVISAGVTDVSRVEAILRETAEDLGKSGRDDRFGDGLVNAAQAVAAAKAERNSLAHLGTALFGLLGLALTVGRRVGRAAARTLFGPGALLGAVLASTGLGFLPGLLGLPLVLWDLGLFGAAWHFSALWASVLPMLVLTVAFVGFPKLRGVLAGLSVGWAAHLLVTAFSGGADVSGIPGIAGVLDRVWLGAQALLLLGLAASVARARARAARRA